jgi:hypothetical protein
VNYMGNHAKKLAGPIIITVLLISYLVFFMVQLTSVSLRRSEKILGIIIPLALIGVSVYVLIERIKEIRSGEEDDLSKY